MLASQLEADLKELLEELLSYRNQDLIRREELGEKHCLKGIDKPAKQALSIFSRIDNDRIVELSDFAYAGLKSAIEKFLNLFREIASYDPAATSNTPDHYLQRLDQLAAETLPEVSALVDYRFPMDHEVSDLLTSVRGLKNEYQEALSITRASLAKEGVGENATYFSEVAEIQRKASWKWLFGVFTLGLFLVVSALLAPLISKITWFHEIADIQLAITKLTIFTVIATFMVVAIRNYSTHRHNELVNRHREKALLTFERLAKAAPDEETKGIILTHASAYIFSPQPTGLVRNEGQTQLPPATEFVRKITE